MTRRIIIGNGPSVLKNPIGEKIDGFDIVVRIGRFQTKGFEKYVGSKTNYWFSLTNDDRQYEGVKKILCSLAAQKLIVANPNTVDFIPKHIVKTAYRYAGIDPKSKMRPTMGLLAITHCLFSFQWPVVYITGFDHCNPNEKKHYWEPDTNQVTYTYHRTEYEKNFAETLIKQGRVVRI